MTGEGVLPEAAPSRPPSTVDRRVPTSTRLIVVAIVLFGIVSAFGLFLVAQGEYQTANDTVTLDPSGNPEIVTLSCRTQGKGIGRLVVVRDADGATVFTATLRPGHTPRASISIDTAADLDYEKALPLGPLDPKTIYKPAQLDDEKGIGIGTTEQAFRPADLRQGEANGGFTFDHKPIGSTPLDQWRADAQATFRGC